MRQHEFGGPAVRAQRLRERVAAFRVVIANGPRQAGKTTLLNLFHDDHGGSFRSLDDATTLKVARADPTEFARYGAAPRVIDEIQRGGNDLVLAIKYLVDRDNSKGQFVLSGSTRFLTVPTLSESLAGRAVFVELWPFAPATLSPGSGAHLQNAATSQCVSGDSFFPGFGTCSANDAYDWTLRPSSGGTFELVNRASGNCLSAPYNNDSGAGLDSCSGGFGGTGYLHWRIGSTTAAGQTLENTETGHCLAITSPPYGGSDQVMVTTCNSDQPQQLWRNGRT